MRAGRRSQVLYRTFTFVLSYDKTPGSTSRLTAGWMAIRLGSGGAPISPTGCSFRRTFAGTVLRRAPGRWSNLRGPSS